MIKMGKIFSISLSDELFEKLEEVRGLIPRSTYINYLLSKLLQGEND